MRKIIEKISEKYFNNFLNRSREPENSKTKVFEKPFLHLKSQIVLKWDKNRTINEEYDNAKSDWLDFVENKGVYLVTPFTIACQIEPPNPTNAKSNKAKVTLEFLPTKEDKEKKRNFNKYRELTENFIDKRKIYFEEYRIHKPLDERSKRMILKFKQSFLEQWDKIEKIEKQSFNIQNFSIHLIKIWNSEFQIYNFDYLAERDPVLYVFKKEIEKIQAHQKTIPNFPTPLNNELKYGKNVHPNQEKTFYTTRKNR